MLGKRGVTFYATYMDVVSLFHTLWF